MDNFKATEYFLDQFRARSWYQCVALCQRYIDCNGVNWEKTQPEEKSQTCQLLYENSETIYEQDTAYTFYMTF